MACANTAESQDFRFGFVHNQEESVTKNFYCSLIVVCLGLGLLTAKPCFSQQVAVTNVTFALQDSSVVVRYTLSGPADKSYRVVLTLFREGYPDFRFIPVDVSGDVGKGNFEGTDRRIVWHLYQDIVGGLPGAGYYFQVSATLLKGGGMAWLYYVGGALVLGGAAAAVLYKSGSIGNSGTSSFPVPPGRP